MPHPTTTTTDSDAVDLDKLIRYSAPESYPVGGFAEMRAGSDGDYVKFDDVAAMIAQARAAAPALPNGDALYKAWHKVGADVAGLRFEDFIAALPSAAAPAPRAQAATGMPFALMVARANMDEIGAWGAQQYEDGKRAALSQQPVQATQQEKA